MEWISVEDGLPKIGQEVLCFYTIGQFQYYCIGKIDRIVTEQVSETEVYKRIEWNDGVHNVITPTHWYPIEPPSSLVLPTVERVA